MKTCESCRFWSERLAYCEGCSPVKAWCFGKGGPHYGKYTIGTQTCDKWAANYLGAVDAPEHEGMPDPYAGETEEMRNTVPLEYPQP